MKKQWIFEEASVECYAGYKESETPRTITFRNRRVEIRDVLDRWYEGGIDPFRPVTEYFKVKTEEEGILLLRYTPPYQTWAVCRPDFAFPQRDL